MSTVVSVESVGTYLPRWTCDDGGGRRVAGPDEDAVTMAVAAGRAADPAGSAHRVVAVSRTFPLLEGGNGAALLAGLSLPDSTECTEVLGGAPAVLDQLLAAAPGTLVIGVDEHPAGACAFRTGIGGATVTPVARRAASLPVRVRDRRGRVHEYGDARLQRDLGARASLDRLQVLSLDGVTALAGATSRQLTGSRADHLAETADSTSDGMLRVLAAAIEAADEGLVVGVEQATATVARLTPGDVAVSRVEPAASAPPAVIVAEGTGIPISLAAYARAFDAKLRWEAASSNAAEDTAEQWFPPRTRVSPTGALRPGSVRTALPRTGAVYTVTTVAIPVPDLYSPYSLVLVELDDRRTRVLMKTACGSADVPIGQRGSIALRRLATRNGVPDYGYAFVPDEGVAR